MVMLHDYRAGLSAFGDPDWDPTGAYSSPGSPRCGPRVPWGTVHRLVDRQGVAELSRVQWLPVRLPLAVVSGEGGSTIASLAPVSG